MWIGLSDGFECVCWRLLVPKKESVTIERKTIVPKVQGRIHLFLIIENLHIKQVTHSLVVIQVEIVIHTVVGREAQQGEDCRDKNKNQINAGAPEQTERDSSWTVRN